MLERNGRALPENKRWEKMPPAARIMAMAEETGLAANLPIDLKSTLTALFAYRNKILHLGFEWPDGDRKAFADRIPKEGWPADWFSQATSDGEPWMFYVTDAFVDHCLATVDQILDGLGAFVRRHETDRRVRLSQTP
jgi:hypothetical protein